MTRLTIIAVSVLLLTRAAFADEVWVCRMREAWTSGPAVSRYWLHGDILSRMGQPPRIYDVLSNDHRAIVSAFGSAIDPDDAKIARIPTEGTPIVGTETFAIDRKTGDAVRGSVELYGVTSPVERGVCHLQTFQEGGAVWPPGFQRDGAPKPDEGHKAMP
jgi:hypothetical protein